MAARVYRAWNADGMMVEGSFGGKKKRLDYIGMYGIYIYSLRLLLRSCSGL